MTDPDAWAGCALLATGVLMLGWAVRASARAGYARVASEGGTIFLGARIMNLGYYWVTLGTQGAIRARASARALSLLSFGLGAMAGGLAAAGRLGYAAWLLALSGICDGLDGAVARATGTESLAGAVLDSALDRYVEFFFFAGLTFYLRGAPLLQLLALLALFGGFMVTYSTAKAQALQATPPRGWMKRAERFAWLVAGSALASAVRLAGYPSLPVLVAMVATIAVFANLSAVVRFRALGRLDR